MDFDANLALWKSHEIEADDLRAEFDALIASGDQDRIYDAFWRDLEFGTGGLRGVIGAGTNRMNIYTIRKATQGLANYIKKNGGKRVSISYDSRIKSDEFAFEAAHVLAANGIEVFITPRLEPTPLLSYITRYFNSDAGICVTASHNPAKYNGYKVYGADGGQITLEAAKAVLAEIDSTNAFEVKASGYDESLIHLVEDSVIDAFVDDVYKQRVTRMADFSDTKICYTPLNGSGLECIKKLFDRFNIKNYEVVKEQEHPDGHFPTCPYPNPEIQEAMQLGIDLLGKTGYDILIGTDPDCDRCGTAILDKSGKPRLITGNELGAIVLNFICEQRTMNGTMPEDPVAVSTIVSTAFVDPIAAKYGVEIRRTLTGFKYIGEQIGLLEKDGEADRYIFGFEESYGYLSGSHVRDKDAVNASLLVIEAVAWYKSQGKTLLDVLEELENAYGYYKNGLLSFTFEGAAGAKFIQDTMADLRNGAKTLGRYAVEGTVDYMSPDTGLPQSNVFEFHLEGGRKVIVRPSGTEPKIKIYTMVRGESEADAVAQLAELNAEMNAIFNK